jgi:uncharacterized protein
VRFVWDPHKPVVNVRKHGVMFEEATTVFADPLAPVTTDAVRVDRALIVGESMLRRVLVTVFVELGAEEMRIISARRATRHERRRYEEGDEA